MVNSPKTSTALRPNLYRVISFMLFCGIPYALIERHLPNNVLLETLVCSTISTAVHMFSK